MYVRSITYLETQMMNRKSLRWFQKHKIRDVQEFNQRVLVSGVEAIVQGVGSIRSIIRSTSSIVRMSSISIISIYISVSATLLTSIG